MRVLISGASGFIGTALRTSLNNAGHTAIALLRTASSQRTDGESVRWDPGTETLDVGSLRDIDAVVHLAGAGIGDKRWTSARRAELRSSRIDSGRLLATAAASATSAGGGPKAYICGSAIGYYGDRGDEVLTEQSRVGSGFLAELCADWEQSAAPAADAGIRVAHIRTGLVLGPGGGLLGTMLPLFRLGIGGVLGSGRQYMSWISLDDEVRAICHLLEHDVSGPVNLTAPNPVTNREFTKALGSSLHRPTVLPVPPFALAARFGRDATSEAFLASQRVLPARLDELGFTFEHPDLTGAFAAAI